MSEKIYQSCGRSMNEEKYFRKNLDGTSCQGYCCYCYTNGEFSKDGSFGFDFSSIYDEVKLNEFISYTIGDGRKVKITFIDEENKTEIIETFEAESTYSIEQQQQGWQSILDNFKKYT